MRRTWWAAGRRPACDFSGQVKRGGRVAGIGLSLLLITQLFSSVAVGSPQAVAAATHRVALITSPSVSRPAPRVGGVAGSTAVPRKPPKEISEIIADRTATSSTWRDSDGTITVRNYAAPHFYKPTSSSGWAPIDTKLSAVAGQTGRWQSGANSFQASFGPAGSAGGAEQIAIGGTTVGFSPKALPTRHWLPPSLGPKPPTKTSGHR
jgi:hypothetical protein